MQAAQLAKEQQPKVNDIVSQEKVAAANEKRIKERELEYKILAKK